MSAQAPLKKARTERQTRTTTEISSRPGSGSRRVRDNLRVSSKPGRDSHRVHAAGQQSHERVHGHARASFPSAQTNYLGCQPKICVVIGEWLGCILSRRHSCDFARHFQTCTRESRDMVRRHVEDVVLILHKAVAVRHADHNAPTRTHQRGAFAQEVQGLIHMFQHLERAHEVEVTLAAPGKVAHHSVVDRKASSSRRFHCFNVQLRSLSTDPRREHALDERALTATNLQHPLPRTNHRKRVSVFPFVRGVVPLNPLQLRIERSRAGVGRIKELHVARGAVPQCHSPLGWNLSSHVHVVRFSPDRRHLGQVVLAVDPGVFARAQPASCSRPCRFSRRRCAFSHEVCLPRPVMEDKSPMLFGLLGP